MNDLTKLPVLVPISDEATQKEADRLFLDHFADDYEATWKYMEEAVSGFWTKWKPAQRRELYLSHEPLFRDPNLRLDYWLTGYDIPFVPYNPEPVAQSYMQEQPMAPMMPMPVESTGSPPRQNAPTQPTPDPNVMLQYAAEMQAYEQDYAKWAEVMARVTSGDALPTDLLQPYWQKLWELSPQETVKMLREYASMLRKATA